MTDTSCVVDIDSLNKQQKEAVLCTKGPLLVLAGAGSGKTRVLTYRIAHMIADEGVQPWQVLAITFTNKAALEMRERLQDLLGASTRGMWVCTFHAMCVRMLRLDGEALGYTSNFTIYDDSDSKRLVKAIMDDLHINNKNFPINMIRGKISDAKNELVNPYDMEANADDPKTRIAAKVYKELEVRLKRANAMDFDDLLVNAYKLLKEHPDILEQYQDRFLQISVDEYQDTNHVQYMIVNMLANKHKNLMVVGDDDQSIYSWRGADLQNILDFEKDYPQANVIKLEQNYRSTGHILGAANAVVAHNKRRKSKRLFTDMGDGELIHVYQASDERDEGRWIASEIEKQVNTNGRDYNDVCVMYRTNAQSRILEDMFLRAGVPYKIVGGTRFFDRAEIRDVTAYLKLIVNPSDDVSAMRVINTPKRGIGKTSIAKIQAFAASERISFFEAARQLTLDNGIIGGRTRSSLAEWCSIIERARKYDGDLAEVIDQIVTDTGLISALEAEGSIEAEGRIENIREFIDVAREFDETHEDIEETLASLAELREAGAVDIQPGVNIEAKPKPVVLPNDISSEKLPAFMEWLALRSDLDSLSGQTSACTMMTIHAAKGLEFPVVFVAGMEEGIFPHQGHTIVQDELEEERRLAYVAITRARQQLYLTNALSRRLYGQTENNPQSRFVREIPDTHIKRTGVGSMGFGGTGWEKRGDRHGTFGSGQGSSMYGGQVFGASTRSSSTRRSSEPRTVYAAPSGKPKPKPTPDKVQISHNTNPAMSTFGAGDTVNHKKFGLGKVLNVQGDMITIRFDATGQTKKLMKGYAPIVKVEG